MTTTNSIYGELNVIPHWYALHTKSRHEKAVNFKLNEKGVTNYLPLNTVYRRWSDRYKEVKQPLFSCYVFVHINLKDRLPVLQTDGAVCLVAFNGKPATIPDDQIKAIKQILDKKQDVQHADLFTPGKKVKVVRGPLKGLDGTLIINKNNHRLVVAIESIKQAISVEIDPRELELIN